MASGDVALDKPVNVALVGCGRISPPHIQAIVGQPGFGRLVAVVDPNLENAKAVAAKYNVPHAVQTLEEVLQIPEVEAVVLCTPNAVHAEQTEMAIKAGRHVLVEKPYAETVEEAERVTALAEASDLVVTPGHTFRHVEAVRVLQDRMAEFGRLRAVSISMCVRWEGPQAPWWATRTPEEGLILSLFAPHAIDFLKLAVGDVDPIRLSVETARHQQNWIAEDEAMILLRYPDDVMASIHVSYNQHKMINRKTLHFANATVVVENGDELWIDGVQVVAPKPLEDADGQLLGNSVVHYFECQFREFAKAVRGQPNRCVRPDQALRQIRLNRAILEKSLQND